MRWVTWSFIVGVLCMRVEADQQIAPWVFDPNTLKLTGSQMNAHLRPVGNMHGLVIDQLGGEAVSPVSEGRAFLNLEHYLEKGRNGEYFPRKLKQTVTMSEDFLAIHFPELKPWPVTSKLTYSFAEPRILDAELEFTFSETMTQFEVYFTCYFTPAYERSIRVNKKWIRPKIDDQEQLLIPRDDKIASRFEDGRWEFLKDRVHLSEERFDLPVMVSTDDATGWTIVQMIEPGLCTHIAPNRFALGHNFIIGGWDVKQGDQRKARVRMIYGQNLSFEEIEKAYQVFADSCRQADIETKPLPQESK